MKQQQQPFTCVKSALFFVDLTASPHLCQRAHVISRRRVSAARPNSPPPTSYVTNVSGGRAAASRAAADSPSRRQTHVGQRIEPLRQTQGQGTVM
ncbi:hypothetical protein E2C01_067294 [Portunus trituberculatus]|uniref:Uncharacterized protein n=1 Tax=Portunus trituberculatus TaxID=210409 RepID=A0A5B7HWA6_PORTR|nr:hypothetical protein [Portunus trituberculatus]